MKILLQLAIAAAIICISYAGCHCYRKSQRKVEPKILSPQPHTFLKASQLPEVWDWRYVNGTNYGSRVMTQQNPAVCGSCWAEAATGAVSDRFAIATNNKLKIQLSPQQLLNFNETISGGSCNGGDDLVAYDFMYRYGISDDSCQPFLGVNWVHGFAIAVMEEVKDVQAHQCYLCEWDGNCHFLPRSTYHLYGVEEYGSVLGVQQMKMEIFARGPISCLVNSDPLVFNNYQGGIISCNSTPNDPNCFPKEENYTDHVVVIAGWGKSQQQDGKEEEYWIGRNSYGTRWGEGSGGGWFRLTLGKNELNIESNPCNWAVPRKEDVQRALDQYAESL